MSNGSGENMRRARDRSAREALDEVERELNVRSRCFPRWVTEGRVSRTDAQDRLDRLATAYDLLAAAVAEQGAKADEPFKAPVKRSEQAERPF